MSERKDFFKLISPGLEDQNQKILVSRVVQPDTVMHVHTFAEIAIIWGGNGLHRSLRTLMPIQRGDVLLAPTGSVHAYENTNQLELCNILFKPEQVFKVPELYQLPGSGALFSSIADPQHSEEIDINILHLENESMARIGNILNDMLLESAQDQPACRLYLWGYLMQLIAEFIRGAKNIKEHNKTIPENIVRVVDFIRKNYQRDLNLPELIKNSHMSLTSFMQKFRASMGVSPMHFLTELRLARACSMLQGTDASISEIAMATGFNDSNYFSRVFHRHLGLTPREFRNENRKSESRS